MMHGADPWWDVAIRLMLKYRNLRLMTSAWSPKRLPDSLLHYMRTRGKDRILFASDSPALSMERTLGEAAALDLDRRRPRPLALRERPVVLLRPARRLTGDAEGGPMDFKPIDADNHYYEPLDAFTRHLDREVRATAGSQPVQDGKRVQLLIGGQVNRFVPNPTFDPIIVPGCLDPLFRGQIPEGVDPRSLMQVEPLREEYRDRDARLAVIEEQGLDAVLLFPTLGCGVEEALRDDVAATMASLTRLQPVARGGLGLRLPGPPDRRADAVARRSRRGGRRGRLAARARRAHRARAARAGARARTAPRARSATSCTIRSGRGSPRRRSRSRSISATAATTRFAAAWGGSATFEGFGKTDVLSRILVSDRAIHDTIASLVVHGVFKRHPTLRVASIENGSDWLHLLVKRLRKQANQTPWVFREDPARHDPPARVGHAVLRGGPRARWPS